MRRCYFLRQRKGLKKKAKLFFFFCNVFKLSLLLFFFFTLNNIFIFCKEVERNNKSGFEAHNCNVNLCLTTNCFCYCFNSIIVKYLCIKFVHSKLKLSKLFFFQVNKLTNSLFKIVQVIRKIGSYLFSGQIWFTYI